MTFFSIRIARLHMSVAPSGGIGMPCRSAPTGKR